MGCFQQKWQEFLPVNSLVCTLNELPSLCKALSPGHLLSLPVSPQWSTLDPLVPALLLSQLPAGGMGGWYVWSPEGTESGYQWHVNPGTDADPQGQEKKAQVKTTRKGGRGGGY